MQTSREIINGLLRKESVERIGLYDSPWPDTLLKWVKEEGYPADADGKPVADCEYFGFDMVWCGGWFERLPLKGIREVLDETDEWIVVRNGAGAAFKTWKHKSGTPEHVDFKMTSRRIWDRDYRPHLLKTDPERIDIRTIREQLAAHRKKDRWAFYGTVFIWELMRSMMGDVCLYESMLLDPDWIHDYCRVYTDFFKAHFTIMIEQAGKPDGVWLYEDMGFNKGLFCSPSVFEKLIFPYYREITDFFHGYELPVVLHSCGRITEALPLIADAGFDALNPMEAKAGCDVLAFAEQYGDRLAFIGGMDARIFESGDRTAIRAEIIRILRRVKSLGARYVFGSDHSISPNVRLADFRYAIDVYRENMTY